VGVHPYLASPCRITLQNLSTLPQQNSASQETTGDQEQQNDSPELVTTGSWLVYAWQKLEGSTLQQDKWVVFHTSYFTVMHCHLLSVSAAVVLTLVFTIGLTETYGWISLMVKGFYYLSSTSLAGCKITVCYYWSGLIESPPSQGKAASNYTCGTCNPVNFTVLKPSD
jgi:hypothetical protein